MIRSGLAMPTFEGMDEAPARAGRPIRLRRRLPRDGRAIWIRLPIAEVERLSPSLEMARYCEALRCQSKRRPATTFHAVVGVPGEADYAWVACADCTGLMMEGAYAT
jgi:hypothetical protein